MNEYRVTKYNPALRTPTGSFTGNEWISFKDVGRLVGGVLLTPEEYGRVEHAYITAALAFLQEAGITALRVEGLENSRKQQLGFGEGAMLPLDRVGEVVGRILREEFWCRLESSSAFLHFGWDYYMYIGVASHCPRARAKAIQLGLYVEDFVSPYHPSPD